MNAIIHNLGDALEVSNFLLKHGVLSVLHQDFSEKIRHTMQMRSCTVSGFLSFFVDELTAMGNRLAVMGLPEGSIVCYELIACIVSRMQLRTAEKHQVSSQPAECTICCEAKDLIYSTGGVTITLHSQRSLMRV